MSPEYKEAKEKLERTKKEATRVLNEAVDVEKDLNDCKEVEKLLIVPKID